MFDRFRAILFLAARDASRRKLAFLLIVLALSFTFFNLLVSYSFLHGLEATFVNGAMGIFGNVYITPLAGQEFLAEDESKLRQIFSQIPEISSYSIHLNMPATLKFEGKSFSAISMIGITSDELSTSTVANNLKDGQFLSFTSDDEIILGFDLADALKDFPYNMTFVHAGNDVEVISASGTTRTFRIRGVIDSKNIYSNFSAYATKAAVERFLNISGKNSEVVIRLKSEKDTNLVQERLKNLGITSYIGTWRDPSGYIAAFVDKVGFFFRLMAVVSLLVGVVVTSAILYIHTERKRRHIGILRALGTSKNFIVGLYTAEGVALSIVGIIVGSAAYAIVYRYFTLNPIETLIGDFRPVISLGQVITVVAIFLLATLIASLLPAQSAARERIKKILAER